MYSIISFICKNFRAIPLRMYFSQKFRTSYASIILITVTYTTKRERESERKKDNEDIVGGK